MTKAIEILEKLAKLAPTEENILSPGDLGIYVIDTTTNQIMQGPLKNMEDAQKVRDKLGDAKFKVVNKTENLTKGVGA